MELNKIFKDGLWSTEINVRDFVSHNITPYYGDASFLEGPTERTKLYGTAASKHWQKKEPITEYAHWIMSPSLPSLLIKPDISTKKTN